MSDPVLIVGCGYLGRRVAQRLLARGERVVALTRSRPDELRALGIEPILGDVTVPESLRLPAASAVVYAVGFDRASGRNMAEVYVEGLTNVLRALPAAGRFAYVSSTGVYGQTDGSLVDEAAPTEPFDESGRVVLAAERALGALRPDAVVLRFVGIYGPGRLFRRADIEAGRPLAIDPEGWLNLIHVEDGADAVVAALDGAAPGATVNVADGTPVRRGDFYRRVAEVLGVAAPTFVPPTEPDRSNRRIVAARMRRELGVVPRYPSYIEGLAAAMSRSG